MKEKEEKPECVKDGITFWPIPEVDGPRVVFGADLSSYFDRRKLPYVPKKYVDMANKLFYEGGKPELVPCVNQEKACRLLKSLLASWGPSHESKETTVGYALWVWSTPEILG